MSEFEFLKLNPELKNYHKIIDKNFGVDKKLSLNVSKNINIPPVNDALKRIQCSMLLRCKYMKGFEINPEFKFNNEDKIVLNFMKNYHLELFLNLKNDTKKSKIKDKETNPVDVSPIKVNLKKIVTLIIRI
jgi:hypothetical protein